MATRSAALWRKRRSRRWRNSQSTLLLRPLHLGTHQGAQYLNQSLRNKRNIFLFWLLLPGLTGGLLSLFPKLFYNISKEERAQMYAELAERRALVRAEVERAE